MVIVFDPVRSREGGGGGDGPAGPAAALVNGRQHGADLAPVNALREAAVDYILQPIRRVVRLVDLPARPRQQVIFLYQLQFFAALLKDFEFLLPLQVSGHPHLSFQLVVRVNASGTEHAISFLAVDLALVPVSELVDAQRKAIGLAVQVFVVMVHLSHCIEVILQATFVFLCGKIMFVEFDQISLKIWHYRLEAVTFRSVENWLSWEVACLLDKV